MNQTNKPFDDILRRAFEEELQAELRALPSEEELSRGNQPSPDFEKRMRRIINAQRAVRFSAGKMLSKAAIVLLCAFSAAAVFAVPQVRALVKEAIVTAFATYTDIQFPVSGEPVPMGKYTLGYLPEGFTRSNTRETPDAGMYAYEYGNADGEEISLSYAPAEDTGVHMDNERREIKQIEINGHEGYLGASRGAGDPTVLVWTDGSDAFTLTTTLSPDTAVKIAKNIAKS